MANNKKTSIGGQALLEGIMMRGPENTAMAVRDPQGGIVLEEFPTKGKDRPAICKKPFIRGVFNLYDSLSFGYKCLMRSAEISGLDEDEKKKKKEGKPSKASVAFEKIMMPLAVVLAVALAVGLFMFLPVQIYSWLAKLFPGIEDMYVLRSVVEGVVKIVIFVGYIWATSLMKDIRRTYMYHGAEHKTIFCYEAGLPLTVENVRKQKRQHPRCGTSFLMLMLLVGIVVGIFIRVSNRFARTGIRLLVFPLIISIGYELIKLAGRKDNLFTKIISAPGLALQLLTTKEPEDGMIECAIAAMERVIPQDQNSDLW